MASPSPTVGQRRLARALRRLRADAGLTIDQVAEKLELSPSTISRMETATVGVKRRDVRELLNIYEVSGAQREDLLQLATQSRKRPWWHDYKIPQAREAGLEAEAATISQYSALLVPGLLQTEAYARAVLDAIRIDPKPDEIESRLRLRMDRRALLTEKDAPRYWVVLDEALLRRAVGGRTTMQAQLEHLVEVAALPSVTIQVLPYSTGAHAGMDGEFTIFSYRDPADPDVVYIENTGGDQYVEDADVTSRYVAIFEHLRAAALNPAESTRTLATIASEL